MAENGVIGRNQQLPWHLPDDLKRFKSLTLNKPILMGRKTWESLPGMLPGRRHIVMSRHDIELPSGCELVASVDEALKAVGDAAELMVVGGSSIYEIFIPLADRLYLTRVDAVIEGDRYFPEINWQDWEEIAISHHAADESHQYPFSFIDYRRVKDDSD